MDINIGNVDNAEDEQKPLPDRKQKFLIKKKLLLFDSRMTVSIDLVT